MLGEKGKGAGRRIGDEYGSNIHSGRERFGVAFEVFGGSIRLACVTPQER